jgi:hypothetical protein
MMMLKIKKEKILHYFCVVVFCASKQCFREKERQR